MLSKSPSTPVYSPAPGVIPDTIGVPVNNGLAVATEPDVAPARASAARTRGGETRGERFRRLAHRRRLYSYAVLGSALVAFLIALADSNTAHVKFNWVFGTSHASLVWLVLVAAIFGWLLGLLVGARFHWRTRAPRDQGGGAR